jgi:molybdopterin converting factor small subunit
MEEQTEQKEEKKVKTFTIEDLEQQLKKKEEYKLALETEYYKAIGQIQLLAQQIETLKECK